MRRISATTAKEGMKLGRAIYDSRGFELIPKGATITPEHMQTFRIYEIAELFIEDWRVDDVPVQPLIAPELEGMATQALRTIVVESQGEKFIDDELLEEAETPIIEMTRELFPEVIGEINASGCQSLKEYAFQQPAKVAGLSLLIGRRMGLGMLELAGVGMAALFKDIGYILLPSGLQDKVNPTSEEEVQIRQHAALGAEIMSQLNRFGPDVAESIYHHHERWDGSGYPDGLSGKEIPLLARIVGICDSYYEMASKRPDRPGYMPHEAVEYIMAFSGDLFDPELVGIFTRQVPLYPTGITVKLNTGETGIISNSNLGHIGRPTVRICFDERSRQIKEPYDLDLAQPGNQGRLIVQVT